MNAVVKLTDPNINKWFAMKSIDKKELLNVKNWKTSRLFVMTERDILSMVKHPFICNSHCIHFSLNRCFSRYIKTISCNGHCFGR